MNASWKLQFVYFYFHFKNVKDIDLSYKFTPSKKTMKFKNRLFEYLFDHLSIGYYQILLMQIHAMRIKGCTTVFKDFVEDFVHAHPNFSNTNYVVFDV